MKGFLLRTIGADRSSNYAEQPQDENDHDDASQRNWKIHTASFGPCWLSLGLVERNAVKGEWKDRRLGWINWDSIPLSIPIRSDYVGRVEKATSGLSQLAMRSTKSSG